MKKLLSAFLVTLLCFQLSAETSPFQDLPEGHWAYGAVKRIHEAGILKGYQDKLEGGKNLTRYEFALLLARTMDVLGTEEGLKLFSPEILSDVDKASVEFDKELSLLGKRCEDVEKMLTEIKKDTYKLKQEILSEKCTMAVPNPKISISGDSTVKYTSITYKDNTAARPVEQFYNSEYMETRTALNLSLKIDEGLRGFVRLENYGVWNSADGDWSSLNAAFGTQNQRRDSDFRTGLALIDVTSIPRLDLLRIGRQPFKLGNLLNVTGTYDGIVIQKTVFDDPYYAVTAAGFKYNNSSALAGNTDTNDNDGLDLKILSLKGNYEDQLMFELYCASLANPQGNLLPNGLATISGVNEDSLEAYTWIGLSLNYNIDESWQLFSEISRKSWENNVDFTGDGNKESDHDTGFIAGVNYQHDIKNTVRAHYMKYNDYFTSIGVTGGSIIRRAEAMGYWRNFTAYLMNYSHVFDLKSTLTLRFEDINDDAIMAAAGQIPDDREVYTAIFRHRYKPNTSYTLTYRYISTSGGDTRNVVPVAMGASSGYVSAAVTGMAANTVDNVYQLNLQMDINF